MSIPVNSIDRSKTLSEYFDKRNQLESLTYERPDENSSEYTKIEEQMSILKKALSELRNSYEQSISTLSLSRCPHTGEIFELFIDNHGIDGLWWDYEAPRRPYQTYLKSYYALSGAILLNSSVEKFTHLCKPGPGAPFVIPRILESPQIKAVICQINVGNHTAYPIVYFSDPMVYDNKRINTWATGSYSFTTENGDDFWGEEMPEFEAVDFQLEKWIQTGKLLWITPQDKDLVLKSTILECPYLNLNGSKEFQYIQNGKIWTKK